MQVTLTQAQLAKLERVREVASHSHCGAGLAEVIEMLADHYLKRKDPLLREVKPRRVTSLKNSLWNKNPLKQNPSANSAVQGRSESKQNGQSAGDQNGSSVMKQNDYLESKQKCGRSTTGAGSGTGPKSQGRNEGEVGNRGEVCSADKVSNTCCKIDKIGSQRGLSNAQSKTEARQKPPKPGQSARTPIKPSVKHLIFKRAQGHCEHVDPESGRRCRSRYLIEIDHIHPVAIGGDNDQTNLRLLCRSHNQLMAKRSIGWYQTSVSR